MPIPHPGQERYPVAVVWAYPKTKAVLDKDKDSEKMGEERKGKAKAVLGKRRRRAKGPHHNLPHYKSEFDGVGSDRVLWTLYAHFEDHLEVAVDEGDEGEATVSSIWTGMSSRPNLQGSPGCP